MPDLPSILVVGELDRSEFSPIRDWLQDVGSAATFRYSNGFDSRRDLRDEANQKPLDDPDLVIICQSWPDEFPAAEVTESLGRWPLAMWVCCYGAWCASDGRTRTIWPISVRVPIDEAAHRLTHVWQVLTGQSDKPLPLTASRDEAFEFDRCFESGTMRPVVRP